MLTPQGCAERQARFRSLLAAQGIDAALITDARDVYYFTGKLFDGHFPTPVVLVIQTSGGTWLAAPTADGVSNVDDVIIYQTSIHATMHLDWHERLAYRLLPKLDRLFGVRRIGWQVESMSTKISETVHFSGGMEWVPIDAMIHAMQRKRDPDELSLIRSAIRADLAAYTGIQKMIEPGVSELDLLATGIGCAMKDAGERVIHDGGYGKFGMASNRVVEMGEMRIIDAWTNYRGYWADLCRVYVVGDKPTQEQQGLYDHVAAAHRVVSPMFKPGVKGTDIAAATDEWLRKHPLLKKSGLTHHAGHGCGIRAHMEPDLNALREGILAEGDVICFEPGGYAPEHHAEARVEDMYLITAEGSENLTNYPYNLVRVK